MRRIVLILVLVAVVGLAGFILLRPKGARSTKKSDSGDSTATGKPTAATTVKKTGGKVTGKVAPKSSTDRKAEAKRIRDAERKRKRELRVAENARRKALRLARSRRGKRRTGRNKGQFYVLKAIVALGDGSYALVDDRRVQVGDVLAGRRIVAIMPDRIEVEAFGKRSTIRVGEPLMPPTFSTRTGR